MSTYSFLNVHAAIVGPGIATSLGAGNAVANEGITIEPTGDKNTMTVGADGEGMHSLHGDKSGTVTVRLLRTSPKNAVLQAAFDAQGVSSLLWGKNLITVTDSASGDVTTCRSCAFKGKPKLTYDKEGAMIEWAFHSIKIDSLIGVFGS